MAREREVKLWVVGATMPQVRAVLIELFSHVTKLMETGVYADAYWPAKNADFARVRYSKDVKLAIKRTGEAGISDREEVQVSLPQDKIDEIETIVEAITGESPTTLLFKFTDFKLDDDKTEISIIVGEDNNLFVEVEGDWLENVETYVKILQQKLEWSTYRVKNSFYDIYVKKQGIQV